MRGQPCDCPRFFENLKGWGFPAPPNQTVKTVGNTEKRQRDTGPAEEITETAPFESHRLAVAAEQRDHHSSCRILYHYHHFLFPGHF